MRFLLRLKLKLWPQWRKLKALGRHLLGIRKPTYLNEVSEITYNMILPTLQDNVYTSNPLFYHLMNKKVSQ